MNFRNELFFASVCALLRLNNICFSVISTNSPVIYSTMEDNGINLEVTVFPEMITIEINGKREVFEKERAKAISFLRTELKEIF